MSYYTDAIIRLTPNAYKKFEEVVNGLEENGALKYYMHSSNTSKVVVNDFNLYQIEFTDCNHFDTFEDFVLFPFFDELDDIPLENECDYAYTSIGEDNQTYDRYSISDFVVNTICHFDLGDISGREW